MTRGSISTALLTLSIAAGVAVTVMPAEAGSAGPVWAKTKTHYSYCFGGNQGTVYFSGVIASAPTERKPELQVPFDKYIQQTYGPNSNTGSVCIYSVAMTDAVNGKKQRETMYVASAWKIVETQWSGGPASVP
jgi:hypothetical protein